MKKITLILALVMGIAISLEAQPRAIGARLGGNAEFSYQHQLGSNMIDATVGVGYFGWMNVTATAVYDWVFPIKSWSHAGAWNWYAGPGIGVGYLFNTTGYGRNLYSGNSYIPVILNVGGQIGVEYQFNFPLTLSVDYRPMFNVLGFGSGYWGDFYGAAIGVRYRF